MNTSFPEATRNEYLSGDVVPVIEAVIRRTRLDFGATLYLENEEEVVFNVVGAPA